MTSSHVPPSAQTGYRNLKEKIEMKRVVTFVYGIVCYSVFFATLLYAIGFLGNFGVPKSIDSGPKVSVFTSMAIDSALLALFTLQHVLMARPWVTLAGT